MNPATAGGNGDVLAIVSAGFTGSINVAAVVLSDESVIVTGNETDVAPAGGVPDRYPAGVSISHVGNPVADHTYPPLPPDPVKFAV
jgi:hypothetical protein